MPRTHSGPPHLMCARAVACPYAAASAFIARVCSCSQLHNSFLCTVTSAISHPIDSDAAAALFTAVMDGSRMRLILDWAAMMRLTKHQRHQP